MDNMGQACVKSLPYSDRAMNIVNVGQREAPAGIQKMIRQGLGSPLRSPLRVEEVM